MRIVTIILMAALGATLALAAGCETVKGVGKDIQGASTVVQQQFFE